MLNIEKSIKDGYKNFNDKPIVLLPAFILSFLNAIVRVMSMSMTSMNIYGIFLFLIAIIIMSLISVFVAGLMVRFLFVKKVSIENEVNNVSKVYLSLLVAGIVYALAVTGGLVALIIPGIIIAIRLGFYNYSVILDRKGFEESLKFSWKITKNNGWRILILGLMLSITAFVLGFFSGLISLVSQLSSVIASFLINAFIIPLFSSIYMMAYLQLKKH